MKYFEGPMNSNDCSCTDWIQMIKNKKKKKEEDI